jgi:hypothetical protein
VISWLKAPTLNRAQLHAPAPEGWRGRMIRFVQVLGPYAAIELLLPGGSLIALLLWLYQSQRKKLSRRHPAGGMSLFGNQA